MALSTRLVMRQGQSLVMTPQLLQAIKLLQFSNVELSAFVEEELERNPLLERVDDNVRSDSAVPQSVGPDAPGDASSTSTATDAPAADWASEEFSTDRAALEESLGTEVENSFDVDRTEIQAKSEDSFGAEGLSATSWTGSPAGGFEDGETGGIESYLTVRLGLREHLTEQLAIALSDPIDRVIGHAIIDAIDDAGYFRDAIEEVAARIGTTPRRAQKVLDVIQGFDPSGVGARDLAECLAIQLREADRYDPAMAAMVAHLPLLAKRDFGALRKLCGVDEDDLSDMLSEIRRLNPKPGRAFGSDPIQPVVADVIVRSAPDGSWRVELNSESLPRLLVNQTYATMIHAKGSKASDKSFVSNCLQSANWLTKSLEQRAKTILKVATEIVRQQDAFFAKGVEHLRPLNLRTIADSIGMHESTVSRVTSNKYLASPRGLFEMKYFFTASIPGRAGAEAHSAEAVRFRIKQLIECESPADVLSDDAIVDKLKEANVLIARRTVAKYRESLRIPSSVERRREKMAAHPS